MFPANVLQDRAFDQLARRRFFKGIEFDAPSGDPGWFGPDSAVWYVHEHVPALVLGLFAAALIETLHPDFAWMGRDHSRGIERVDGVPTGRIDPEGALVRAGHSYSFFMAVAYGSTRSAEQVVRAVSGMHHTVRGVRPDGRRYDADDPETLRWAYATVVWGIAAAHSRYTPGRCAAPPSTGTSPSSPEWVRRSAEPRCPRRRPTSTPTSTTTSV
jgi:uncharacterized protein (DUF2236 family)